MVLAVAILGITAILLSSRITAYSCFKILIDVNKDSTYSI
jgi:hypothetical protein